MASPCDRWGSDLSPFTVFPRTATLATRCAGEHCSVGAGCSSIWVHSTGGAEVDTPLPGYKMMVYPGDMHYFTQWEYPHKLYHDSYMASHAQCNLLHQFLN